ncbi:MAG TPA: YdbH domain-containing protein [Dongiaceae bacterium]|nr:YdbH domain-containing protein [Dongiaceae bacterium]
MADRAEQRRRRRRWPVVLLLAVVLLGIACVGFRERIAAWAATEALSLRYDLPSKLEINDLGAHHASIGAVSLGAAGQLKASDISLQFTPTAMRIERIEIGRLDIHAHYDGHVLSLGEIDPLFRELMAPGDGPGTEPPSSIILHRIVLTVDTPLGPLAGDGMATIDHNVIYSQFTLTETQQRAALHLDLNATLGNRTPQPQGKITGDLSANSVLWDILHLPRPSGGTVHVEAQLKTPPGDNAVSGIRIATGSLVLAADWRITGDKLTWDGSPLGTPLVFDGNGRAVLSERRLDIPNFAIQMSGGWSSDLSANLQGAGILKIEDDKPTAQGNIDMAAQLKALAFGPNQFKAPAVDLGWQFGFDGDRVTLQPSRDGTLKFTQASFGPVRFNKATTVTLKKNDASRFVYPLRPDDEEPIEASFALGALSTEVALPGMDQPVKLAVPGGTFSFTSTPSTLFDYAFDAKGATLTLAQPQADVQNLQVSLKSTGGKIDIALKSPAIHGAGAAPAALDAKANVTGSKLTLNSKLSIASAQATLTANGSYDLAQGRGRFDVELPPITFAPGGLQPKDLVPALAHSTDGISGTVAVKGPILLDKNGITSQIELNLQDLSGKVGPIALKNLNSVIEVDRPWPLTTAPDQIVSVELADVGLPLTNGLVRFKIDDGTTMSIAESHLEMMSGHVTLEPVTLKLGAPAQQIHLNVDKVSLARLFELFAVAGLSGDGQLSGAIPVTLFPAGLAIDHAKLEAEGPGSLRYNQAQAPAALQGAGDSVKLAMSALSDFHYDKLEVDLDRAATGDTELGLHIAGRNPSFYNGYPVEFNLAVTGRLDEALRKGLAGYQVPDMIREKLKSYNQ